MGKATETSIIDKFLSLLFKYEIEEITVPLLLEELYYSRATFYYHFRSVDDVVAAYYLNEEISGIKTVASFQELFDLVYAYLSENEVVASKILKSSVSDYLFAFLLNQIRKGFLSLNERKHWYQNIVDLEFSLFGAFGLLRKQLENSASLYALKPCLKQIVGLLDAKL
ncbi:MAG: TetR/AcrR family transcriptional regulator [Erysipelotrichaceae bacterium]|jgi:AcrR family transcriptional regulator|nr:TetR/AcrR family transcriptional regulator [Erysipelotrichaceae bacterium]